MSTEKYYKKFEEKKCCVVVPTYNNCLYISEIINDILEYTDQLIVINDGSNDCTLEVLSNFPKIHIVTYDKNKGKGYAIRRGLKMAEILGYEYAITMDSDGQHFAKDLCAFIEVIDPSQKQIFIGTRNIGKEDRPKKRSFANRFSNFWFFIETGIRHPDTQSGFRLYPIKIVNKRKYFSNKYEFEIEVIVRNAWRGVEIKSIPIDVYYPEDNEKRSHFRPFKDFFRISILNTILVIVAFFYGLPLRLFHFFRKKSFKEIIRDNILQSKDSNLKISKAVGFGFFMGILPIWGWQTIVAIALSHYLKLNKAIVVLAANISIPPMMPIILFLSFYTGALVTGNDLNLVHFASNMTLETVSKDILQYIIGSIVLAILTGLTTFGTTILLLKLFRRKNRVN
jgi:glycosyltransferase involved in cell wall biosynthesis